MGPPTGVFIPAGTSVSITAWGVGNKPRLSRFISVWPGGWEAAPDCAGAYRLKAGVRDYYHVPSIAACVRPKDSGVNGDLMRCMATLADCAATPGSWTNDGGILHVHPANGEDLTSDVYGGYDYCPALPANIPDSNPDGSYSNAGPHGLRNMGDYCRIQGIAIEGAGADYFNQANPGDPANTTGGSSGYSIHHGAGTCAYVDCELSYARRAPTSCSAGGACSSASRRSA